MARTATRKIRCLDDGDQETARSKLPVPSWASFQLQLLPVAASPSNLAEEVEDFEDFLTAGFLFLLIDCLRLPSISRQLRASVAQ